VVSKSNHIVAMKNFFQKIPVWLKIAFIVLLMAVAWGIWFWANKSPVKPPADFLIARQKGAEISQKIVELTLATNQKISEINSLDLNGDYLKALNYIEEAKNRNKETLNQAVKLANEVQKMTEFLDKISLKSREIAIKAITSENYLLTNFMNYNQIFGQFLGNLRGVIATSKIEYRQAAENNLSELNIKTAIINNLNQEFIGQMEEFDKSFAR